VFQIIPALPKSMKIITTNENLKVPLGNQLMKPIQIELYDSHQNIVTPALFKNFKKQITFTGTILPNSNTNEYIKQFQLTIVSMSNSEQDTDNFYLKLKIDAHPNSRPQFISTHEIIETPIQIFCQYNDVQLNDITTLLVTPGIPADLIWLDHLNKVTKESTKYHENDI
jgi:hypothetical protein